MADPTEQIETVLRENGIGEPESTLHSWRCSYPDRYGPCNCLAELVGDLAALLAAREAAGGARALREAAEAVEAEREDKWWVLSTHERDGMTYALAIIAAQAERIGGKS